MHMFMYLYVCICLCVCTGVYAGVLTPGLLHSSVLGGLGGASQPLHLHAPLLPLQQRQLLLVALVHHLRLQLTHLRLQMGATALSLQGATEPKR